ncbi:MAG TPA: 3-oxoadipate enol-lactonase [Chryseolinea sp.]
MTFANINGHYLHYEFTRGARVSDNTFLFINSLGTDFRIWNEVAESLRGYGNILLFDNRGHGLSDVVAGTERVDDFADDTEALMQYLGITKCIPVGLSVGGMIAQLLAVRSPNKFSKLILCDTRHKIGNATIWNDRIKVVGSEGLASISAGVMQRWFSKSFHEQHPQMVAGYKNMLERTPPMGYIQTCVAIRDGDLTEIAKGIKMPTLCLVGSEDKSTSPEEVKNLSDLIEGSKFEIIPGSGHIPCVDNAAQLADLVLTFIKE